MNDCVLELIKKTINNSDLIKKEFTLTDLSELFKQTLHCLPIDYIDDLILQEEVRNTWNTLIYNQIQNYYTFIQIQNEIDAIIEPVGVIPIVIKGLSVAKYYDHPEYRLSGDIDVILSPNTPESFEKVRKVLSENGFVETKNRERHIVVEKDGVPIELHRYFSKREFDSERILDDIISSSNIIESNIPGCSFYSFDDLTNGLIILDHIEQHLDSGVGFRHIIDWLMFAKSCLYGNEKATKSYLELVESISLLKLCIHIQRLGEIYFNMPIQDWSTSADDSTVHELYQLIDTYGNLGHAQDYVKGGITKVLTNGSISLSGLQKRGIKRWDAARKYPILRPFAWAYQLGMDVKRGIKGYNKNSGHISDNITEAKKRLALMKKLDAGRYRK